MIVAPKPDAADIATLGHAKAWKVVPQVVV